jgi:hypothetical protein
MIGVDPRCGLRLTTMPDASTTAWRGGSLWAAEQAGKPAAPATAASGGGRHSMFTKTEYEEYGHALGRKRLFN